MPITPEERARIARENGAKSRGPVTQEGKDRSRLNSFKTGEHAQALAHLVPTDEVVTTLEDRREYALLLNSLILQYRPVNDLALSVVTGIAANTWYIRRYRHLITAQWNAAALAEAGKPAPAVVELHELAIVTGTARELHTGAKLVLAFHNQIARLETAIARLERRLKFIHDHFAAPGPEPEAELAERTQPEIEPAVENTELSEPEPENCVFVEDPVVLETETPEAIATARRDHPGRPIVLIPARAA